MQEFAWQTRLNSGINNHSTILDISHESHGKFCYSLEG